MGNWVNAEVGLYLSCLRLFKRTDFPAFRNILPAPVQPSYKNFLFCFAFMVTPTFVYLVALRRPIKAQSYYKFCFLLHQDVR